MKRSGNLSWSTPDPQVRLGLQHSIKGVAVQLAADPSPQAMDHGNQQVLETIRLQQHMAVEQISPGNTAHPRIASGANGLLWPAAISSSDIGFFSTLGGWGARFRKRPGMRWGASDSRGISHTQNLPASAPVHLNHGDLKPTPRRNAGIETTHLL